MATLTYDPSEAPPEGELTEEEQDSLQVGEQLEQAEQQMLAGKFKSAEDLEKAYIELQSKLGEPKEEAEPEPEAPEPEANFLETLWEEAQNNTLTEETAQRLQGMNPEEIAKLYVEERAKRVDVQVTNEQAQQLRDTVGGDEAYKTMIGWASENFSKQEVSMYDAIMQKGDPNAMYFAIQALNSRYQGANSIEGKLITGKAPAPQGEGFRSQAEVVRAMSDPRYDSDPAYRQDVAEKLERSDINF